MRPEPRSGIDNLTVTVTSAAILPLQILENQAISKQD